MVPAIYIAGTGQHSGKTMFSLGLVAALRECGRSVGYMKPVGQRAVQADDAFVDEDVVLMAHVFGTDQGLSPANPVTLPAGYTTQFLSEDLCSDELVERILKGYQQISEGNEFVVVEGTGHAGVGAVVGLSNAKVASILGAKVLIIMCGGLGRPIDEFSLNEALFDKEGVAIAGVVANKFLASRLDEFVPLLRKWFDSAGVPLLGVIPYETTLTEIALCQIVSEIGADVINGEESLDRRIRDCIIGAAPPHRLIPFLEPGVLAIIPGDRDDLVLTAVSCEELIPEAAGTIAVCLTSGILPHPNTLRIIRQSHVPVIAVKGGTFSVASEISDLVAKMMPGDTEKIELAKRLVANNIDLDATVAAVAKGPLMLME